MQILLVEDIEIQASWLVDKLKARYPDCVLRHVRTESEFRGLGEGLHLNPPSLAIIDMMLRWCDPAPSMPPLSDDAKDEGRRAGLRCAKILRASPRSANVPIIITTILEDIDFEDGEIPADVKLVTKESDPADFFRAIDAVRTEVGKS